MSTRAKKKPEPKVRHKVDRPRIPGAPLTIGQVADALNIAPRTVRKRIAEGKLPAYRDGRCVRVLEADLAAYRAGLGFMVPAGQGGAGPGTGLAVRRHLRPSAGKGARG